MRRRTIFLKNAPPAEAFPIRILTLDWHTSKHPPPKADPMQASLKHECVVACFKITIPEGILPALSTSKRLNLIWALQQSAFSSLKMNINEVVFQQRKHIKQMCNKRHLPLEAKGVSFKASQCTFFLFFPSTHEVSHTPSSISFFVHTWTCSIECFWNCIEQLFYQPHGSNRG